MSNSYKFPVPWLAALAIVTSAWQYGSVLPHFSCIEDLKLKIVDDENIIVEGCDNECHPWSLDRRYLSIRIRNGIDHLFGLTNLYTHESEEALKSPHPQLVLTQMKFLTHLIKLIDNAIQQKLQTKIDNSSMTQAIAAYDLEERMELLDELKSVCTQENIQFDFADLQDFVLHALYERTRSKIQRHTDNLTLVMEDLEHKVLNEFESGTVTLRTHPHSSVWHLLLQMMTYSSGVVDAIPEKLVPMPLSHKQVKDEMSRLLLDLSRYKYAHATFQDRLPVIERVSAKNARGEETVKIVMETPLSPTHVMKVASRLPSDLKEGRFDYFLVRISEDYTMSQSWELPGQISQGAAYLHGFPLVKAFIEAQPEKIFQPYLSESPIIFGARSWLYETLERLHLLYTYDQRYRYQQDFLRRVDLRLTQDLETIHGYLGILENEQLQAPDSVRNLPYEDIVRPIRLPTLTAEVCEEFDRLKLNAPEWLVKLVANR